MSNNIHSEIEAAEKVAAQEASAIASTNGTLKCKTCRTGEKKDVAGNSNISYTYGVCLDCLMGWR